MKSSQSFLKLLLCFAFIFCGFVFACEKDVKSGLNDFKSAKTVCDEGALKTWARNRFGNTAVDYGPSVIVGGSLAAVALSQYKKPFGISNPLHGLGKTLKKHTISFFCLVAGVMWWRGGWGNRFDHIDKELEKAETHRNVIATKSCKERTKISEQLSGACGILLNVSEDVKVVKGDVKGNRQAIASLEQVVQEGFKGQEGEVRTILSKLSEASSARAVLLNGLQKVNQNIYTVGNISAIGAKNEQGAGAYAKVDYLLNMCRENVIRGKDFAGKTKELVLVDETLY